MLAGSAGSGGWPISSRGVPSRGTGDGTLGRGALAIKEWRDERTEGMEFDRKELARESGRNLLDCPGNISGLAGSVGAVDVEEADNLLLLAPSETVPEIAVLTVTSESLLDREDWSTKERVEGFRSASAPECWDSNVPRRDTEVNRSCCDSRRTVPG